MTESKWIRIGFTLMIGLFVAYLDRSNLSVGLPDMSKEIGFSGSNFAVTSSWVLTSFLIGYALANVFGGIFSYKMNPKTVVIVMVILISITTISTSFVHSVASLVALRFILGVAEGIYWPQQSRFAEAWFNKDELTRANTIIQYYGQFSALALGFLILTPIYQYFGWRPLFYITGLAGLIIVLPLYIWLLQKEPKGVQTTIPHKPQVREKLTWRALGGAPFILMIFAHLGAGMLFWGITLWIPLTVKSLGFSGFSQGWASSLPYIAAVVLAIPMSIISDRTGKRILIAATSLIFSGIILFFLPMVNNPLAKLLLISLAFGYNVSTYTPNAWSIIQSRMTRNTVGPAIGIVNGIGAGGGGTIAGFIVGLLYKSTGSFVTGFAVIGIIAIVGGLALIVYGRIPQRNVEVNNDAFTASDGTTTDV